MAKYTYRCDFLEDGSMLAETLTHSFELQFPIGKAPEEVKCQHHHQMAIRDIFTDARSLTIDHIGDDPFRKYHLSGQGNRAAEAQQRNIEGPRDRSEARAIEAATGRKYIGNNTESLTPKEQKALESRGYGKV